MINLEELIAMIKHVNLSNFKFDIDFEDQRIRWATFDTVSEIYYKAKAPSLLLDVIHIYAWIDRITNLSIF